jgi:hypothetical protein
MIKQFVFFNLVIVSCLYPCFLHPCIFRLYFKVLCFEFKIYLRVLIFICKI